jgi:hypothetical protein
MAGVHGIDGQIDQGLDLPLPAALAILQPQRVVARFLRRIGLAGIDDGTHAGVGGDDVVLAYRQRRELVVQRGQQDAGACDAAADDEQVPFQRQQVGQQVAALRAPVRGVRARTQPRGQTHRGGPVTRRPARV